MSQSNLVFDIETGPLPDEILVDRVKPYVPPPPPGEFDPAAVKLGNVKDPLKIREKIESTRQKNLAEVAGYEASLITGEAEWLAGIRNRAALSPLTGQVLAIGYLSVGTGESILDHVIAANPETEILARFWDKYQDIRSAGCVMVGHNVHGFDVPFLAGRSWLLGVDVPETVFERGRYVDSRVFVDTMIRFAGGTRNWVGLGILAHAMGVGGKPDGVDGSMFSELFKTDLQAALAYLQNDLDMTRAVASRLGVI